MTLPSQPSDKLKSILGRRREETVPLAPTPRGEAGVDDLLDRGRELPDPWALSRLYKDSGLAQLLPEDESEAPSPAAPSLREQTPIAVPTPDRAGDVSDRPAMSRAEIRQVMQELSQAFESTGYTVVDRPMAGPVEVVVDRDAVEDPPPPTGGDWVFYLGALLALAVVGGFIYLALYGPAPFHSQPSPSPGGSPRLSAPATSR